MLRDQVIIKYQYDEVHEFAELIVDEMLLPKHMGSLGRFSHSKCSVVEGCILVTLYFEQYVEMLVRHV